MHKIRNSLKYVGSANQKQFAKELKNVYQAFTKEEAEIELDKLSVFFFKYLADIRKVIYTTNIIKSVHFQIKL